MRGTLALDKVRVVWHVLPVFPVHGPLLAHHLLFAFPAIKLETAGKPPLVQIQSFAVCCMQVLFHILSPLPQQGNWAVMCGQARVNDAPSVATISGLWVCSEARTP